MLQLSTIFKVNSKDVESCTGLIRVLLGQESQELLLEKATHINQMCIYDYLPDFCRDMSIQLSPATSKLSIVGAVGQPALKNFQPGSTFKKRMVNIYHSKAPLKMSK